MDDKVSETTSSILRWLVEQPVESISYTAIPSWQKTSRRHDLGSWPGIPQKIKRNPLEEIVNGMPERKKKRTEDDKNVNAAAPGELSTPRQSNERPFRLSASEDDDATPRSSIDQGEQLVLSPPSDLYLSRGDSSPTRSGTTTSFSRSPVRRLGDLQLTSNPVRAVGIDSVRYPLPIPGRHLSDGVEKIAFGQHVIPDVCKTCARSLIAEGKLQESNFGAELNPLIPSQPPRARSDQQVWERVEEILYEARTLKEDFASEPAWNTEVHSRILNLVLHGWREEWELCYLDATTARIFGSPVVSKMIDYAICIAPDIEMEDRIFSKLRSQDSTSINHTRAEFIRFKPIAISIETKRPGMDEDTGELQLGVWAAAHFDRLQQLSGHDRMPILPQIFIQGHDWRLKIAVLCQKTVIVHGDVPMGDTRNHLGIYKILACLRYLCNWARTDYREWFLENCLIV